MKVLFLNHSSYNCYLKEEVHTKTINEFIEKNGIIDLRIEDKKEGIYCIGRTKEDLNLK